MCESELMRERQPPPMWFQSQTLKVSAPVVEADRGPGAPSDSPADPDQLHHLQQDRQAGGHLLGRGETLWSHVSLFW